MQLDNYVDNKVENEINLDYLSQLLPEVEKPEENEKLDINNLSKLIKWKKNQFGKKLISNNDFAAWALMLVYMEKAEIVGNKKNIFVATLSKTLNFTDTNAESFKVGIHNSIVSGTFAAIAREYIAMIKKMSEEKSK